MKKGIVAALVTVALGSFTVQNEIMANEGSENIASSIDADTHEGSRSRGGPFTLETRNATSREASAGGTFRLVGSTQLKAAEDEIFFDGFENGDPSVWSIVVPPIDLPSGAVAFFELEECPPGWSHNYAFHRGRAVVGLMSGGQWNLTVGSQTNGQSGFHYHDMDYSPSTSSYSHNHRWAYLMAQPDLSWRSYSVSGSVVTMIQWSNGIDGAGSGYFLFAPTPQQSFYTNNNSHNHTVAYSSVIGGYGPGAIPNVQLLICEKQ